MKTRAIIFDIDGTAVDSPKRKLPSKNLVKAVESLKREYYICAATGRVWSFAKPVLRSLRLTDPCIISGGTQICNPIDGRILWQRVIDADALSKAMDIFRQYNDYGLLYNDFTEDDYHNGGESPRSLKLDNEVYFVDEVFIPDKIAPRIYEKLGKIDGLTCVMTVSHRTGCIDLHIMNKNATKEQTVAELLKLIKVRKKDTIGIGDGYNDLHLFNAVGHKVAVGNAVPELKSQSDLIIESVSEDGMAKYLNTLI